MLLISQTKRHHTLERGVEFPKGESPFIVTEEKPQEGEGETWEEEAEEACPEPEHD